MCQQITDNLQILAVIQKAGAGQEWEEEGGRTGERQGVTDSHLARSYPVMYRYKMLTELMVEKG